MLKTKYKYVHFSPSGNTDCYNCLNTKHREILGEVLWYAGWKQYIFRPSDYSEFSADCLDDISHFLKQLNSVSK